MNLCRSGTIAAMNCPTDGAELVMSERQGVEIDYCPKCRGVWLDRGELDKILDRAGNEFSSGPRDEYRPPEESRGAPPRKKKKKNFLEDIFEFGG
jgi:uncharacterized protein